MHTQLSSKKRIQGIYEKKSFWKFWNKSSRIFFTNSTKAYSTNSNDYNQLTVITEENSFSNLQNKTCSLDKLIMYLRNLSFLFEISLKLHHYLCHFFSLFIHHFLKQFSGKLLLRVFFCEVL